MPAFLLLEGALYLSFLALDLLSTGPLSTALKYAALLLCLGLPLFTGLLACAPWVLPGLVLGVSLPLLLAFFLCTPPGGLG